MGKDPHGLHPIHPPIPCCMCLTRQQQTHPSTTGSDKGTSLPHLHHHPPSGHQPLLQCQLLGLLQAWGRQLHHLPLQTHPLHIMGPRTLACLPHQGAHDIQVPSLYPLPPHSPRGPLLPPRHPPLRGTHHKAMCLPPQNKFLAPTPINKAPRGF